MVRIALAPRVEFVDPGTCDGGHYCDSLTQEHSFTLGAGWWPMLSVCICCGELLIYGVDDQWWRIPP